MKKYTSEITFNMYIHNLIIFNIYFTIDEILTYLSVVELHISLRAFPTRPVVTLSEMISALFYIMGKNWGFNIVPVKYICLYISHIDYSYITQIQDNDRACPTKQKRMFFELFRSPK